jgi:hypothetical protein
MRSDSIALRIGFTPAQESNERKSSSDTVHDAVAHRRHQIPGLAVDRESGVGDGRLRHEQYRSMICVRLILAQV